MCDPHTRSGIHKAACGPGLVQPQIDLDRRVLNENDRPGMAGYPPVIPGRWVRRYFFGGAAAPGPMPSWSIIFMSSM